MADSIDVRISQAPVEIIESTPDIRISQSGVEAIKSDPSDSRITQWAVELITDALAYGIYAGDVRIGQFGVEVIISDPIPNGDFWLIFSRFF